MSWRADYPMAKISSWRAGGVARWLFTPDCREALRELADCSEPILFVGYGSNLLVRDGGYDGIVVRTSPGLTRLELRDDGTVYAEAGVGCPKLARFCADSALAGAEFFAGIPGSVGGALAMNAGCHGGETWRFVRAVFVFDGREIRRAAAGEFEYSYRAVRRPPNTQFVAACFKFARGEADESRREIKQLLRARGESQPLGQASAGSVFVNPPQDFAGRLIEQCGLKGMRIGAAQVSAKHANFIINVGKNNDEGGAAANDIEDLITRVQQTVRAKTGVQLRPEVRIVGKRQ